MNTRGAKNDKMYKSKDNFLNEQERQYYAEKAEKLRYMQAASEYAECLGGLMDTINTFNKAKYPHEKTLLVGSMWDSICATNKAVSEIMKPTPQMSASADHELNALNLLS